MAKIEQTFEIELSAQEYLDACNPEQLRETLLLLLERLVGDKKSPKKDKPAKKSGKIRGPYKKKAKELFVPDDVIPISGYKEGY
ncbi:hypothetical protein AGMMS4956_14300 [Bacteroidia bacterium]|nr:hypothetical protein AGMMS4956_14300 [Bacteroidia bacterium]